MAKTHFKKLRNPDYLGSWDLADENGNFKNRIMTITEVKKEMVHDGKGGKDECVTVHFQGSKPMIMNSTNLKTIHKSLGTPYIEDWVGKKIEITVEQVKAFGEIHDALRVVKTSLELTPKHPKWNGAKTALVNGTVTIEAIKKQYTLSPENEALLCS
jgi:hypothetical protein